MTNELLLHRARGGDPQAFEALVTPYEAMVWRVCWHYLENHEDAQDAAQEVMLKAWRSLGTFRGDASLETWLYRVCVNVCVDALRKRHQRKDASLNAMAESGYDPVDATPGTEAQLERIEQHETLRAALRQLPEEMRTPLLLSAVEGRSYEEIAHITGAHMGTVKSRINRARKKLSETLHRWEQSDPSCVQSGERRARP